MYSPANLDSRDELNLHELNRAGYASVVSLGNVPSDPMQWEYGMVLKYNLGGLDSYNTAPSCRACELSGGVCGYAPPHNSFVCVCQNGVNTTTDCYNYLHGQWLSVSSTSYFSCKLILSTFFFPISSTQVTVFCIYILECLFLFIYLNFGFTGKVWWVILEVLMIFCQIAS